MEKLNRLIPTGEPLEKLKRYCELVQKWQKTINLIGPTTVSDIWQRHVLDSYQLMDVAPSWQNWLDLGSGGGFPGLVVAIAGAGDANRSVHLVESDRRKVAFLREVSRETGTPVEIHPSRIEELVPKLSIEIDFQVVSARALAPLDKLLEYSGDVIRQGAVGLFLKGKGVHRELTSLEVGASFEIQLLNSSVDSEGKIVVVRSHNQLRPSLGV